MFYHAKDSYIEAFQFDGDLMNTKGKWYVPDWAVNAYQNGILRFEGENMFLDDVQVFAGDYVAYKYGKVFVIPAFIFEKLFAKE